MLPVVSAFQKRFDFPEATTSDSEHKILALCNSSIAFAVWFSAKSTLPSHSKNIIREV
jgi:hypothetical protein